MTHRCGQLEYTGQHTFRVPRDNCLIFLIRDNVVGLLNEVCNLLLLLHGSPRSGPNHSKLRQFLSCDSALEYYHCIRASVTRITQTTSSQHQRSTSTFSTTMSLTKTSAM